MLTLSFDQLTDPKKFAELKSYLIQENLNRLYFIRDSGKINNDLILEENVETLRKTKKNSLLLNDTVLMMEIATTQANFNIHYVIPLLPEFYDEHKNRFCKTYDEDHTVLSESGEEKFKRTELYRLNVISNEIDNSTHLDEPLKQAAIAIIDELYGFINAYKQNEVTDKIPFNLSKNEVITLFHLLFQKKVISQDLDKRDISRLIGRNFEYFSSKDKKYLPVIKPGKQENNLLTDHAENNPELTLRKLKKIFTAKDFFDYKIATKNGDKKLTP